METTPERARALVTSNVSVEARDPRALSRLPLRQRWRVLPGPAESVAAPDPPPQAGDGCTLAILSDGTEGELLALHERALSRGRDMVRNAHRGAVAFSAPQVHTFVDPVRNVLVEPLMFVKVNARREHLDMVLQMLRERGTRVQDVELQGRRAVVRAQSMLEHLLGFEDALVTSTSASAQVFTWLLRYDTFPPAALYRERGVERAGEAESTHPCARGPG